MAKPNLGVDQTSFWRWVRRYALELSQRVMNPVKQRRSFRFLLLSTLLLQRSVSLSQTLQDLSPEIREELARSPVPPLSNRQVGIDIDRFIGHPFQSPVRVSRDVIMMRTILRHGDPYKPGEPGAVLENRQDLSVGTVLGHRQTPLVELNEHQFWYIESGTGRLDNGSEYWNLKEGTGALIPPRMRHRVANTSDEPLEILMLTWDAPGGVRVRKDILVRNVQDFRMPQEGSHWNYFGTDFFAPEDGLHSNEQFAVVFMPPMTIAEPHAHIPHWEEVWVKLPPDSSYLMLGSEVREMPPNTAFLAPPNSKTVHSVVNLLKDKTQAFMYLGRWAWKQPPRLERPEVKPRPLTELKVTP
jgi:mannose-6-phosphate isomerase-like protein (cupin superfamily)